MAKIIIIASPDDKDSVTKAKELLEADGHEVVVEDPTPKALTSILLGLMSKGGFGFGPRWGYAPEKDEKEDKEEKEDKPEDKAEPEVEVDVDFDDGGGVDESLGMVEVDGELMEAFRVKSATTSVQLPYELSGGRVSYQINESQFAFWVNDPKDVAVSMTLTHAGVSREVSLNVKRGDVAKLFVGDDLPHLHK